MVKMDAMPIDGTNTVKIFSKMQRPGILNINM